MATRPAELRKVIGANARRLRTDAGVSLEEFVREGKKQGLPWTTGRVGDLEGGRIDAGKLETLVSVALTLAATTGRDVRLADLVRTDQRVMVNGRELDDFASLFEGCPVRVTEAQEHEDNPTAPDLAQRNGWPDVDAAAKDFGVRKSKVLPLLIAYDEAGLAERRAAKALDISLVELTRRSVVLWGHSLTSERERVAEAEGGANNARLGQISRSLREQLEATQ